MIAGPKAITVFVNPSNQQHEHIQSGKESFVFEKKINIILVFSLQLKTKFQNNLYYLWILKKNWFNYWFGINN